MELDKTDNFTKGTFQLQFPIYQIYLQKIGMYWEYLMGQNQEHYNRVSQTQIKEWLQENRDKWKGHHHKTTLPRKECH